MSVPFSARKRVAISMRVVHAQGYDEPRDALAQDWIPFLEELGYIPVFIPNNLESPKEYFESLGVSGLILSGGNDLAPEAWNSELHIEKGSDDSFIRDKNEQELFQTAISNAIPVLGVCRGMQIINACLGGGNHSLDDRAMHVANIHSISLNDSVLQKIAKNKTIDVNSYHAFGILKEDVANPLQICATSSDGSVESFYHPEIPVLGMMWHPERKSPSKAVDLELIKTLISSPQGWMDQLTQ